MAGDEEKTISIGEFLSQFQNVKYHFVNSQREMLLGFREICKILEGVAESSSFGIGGEFPLYILKAVGSVIDYFLARVPEDGKPADILEAKIKAIDELIVILQEESERVAKDAGSEIDLAKVEAIQAIQKYLRAEKEAAVDIKENPDEHRHIRKVVIE